MERYAIVTKSIRITESVVETSGSLIKILVPGELQFAKHFDAVFLRDFTSYR